MDFLGNFLFKIMEKDSFFKIFTFFGIFSLIFFILMFAIWVYSFYICYKTEKDVTKRNIWFAIIIVGKFTGAILYLIFEKFLKSNNDFKNIS